MSNRLSFLKHALHIGSIAVILVVPTATLADTAASGNTDAQSVVTESENYEHRDDTCPGGTAQSAALTNGTAALPTGTSDDQKIGQTFILGFDTSVPKPLITDLVTKFKIGGIYITGPQGTAGANGFDKAFYDSLSTAAGVRVTAASDEEGGQVHNYSYSFNFPSAKQMGTMSDADLEALGKQVGQAMASNGLSLDLSPVLDIDSGRGSGDVISGYERAFSSDPATVAAKAGAFTKGIQSAGINTTFKHFPGLGFADGPSMNNTDKAVATAPNIDTLKNRDLVPYKTLLSQYPSTSVMMSNESVKVNAADPGAPASISKPAVDLLRGEYGFGGAITTDDLNVPSITGQNPINVAVAKALQAGITMPLFGAMGASGDIATAEANVQAVIDQVKKDVSTTQIDDAVAKVMAFKNASLGNSSSPSTAGACCPTVGASSGSTPINAGGSNSETIYHYFRDKGATAAGAAGVVGNFVDESGGQTLVPGPDPKAVSPSGYYGIEQWGGGRYSGPDGLLAFAADQGGSWDDLTIQLKFSTFELGVDKWTDKAGVTHSPPSWVVPAWAVITDPSITDPQVAAQKFEETAEGCIEGKYSCGFDVRRAQAQAAYDAFHSYIPVTSPGSSYAAPVVCSKGGSTVTSGNLSQIILSYAWPEYHAPNWLEMMPGYAAAREKALKEGRYVSSSIPGADCNEFVTMVVHDSGIDTNYNSINGGTSATLAWIQDPANGWYALGPSGTAQTDAANLRPGDVALKDGHTFIFVGDVSPTFDTQRHSGIASASQDERTGMAAGDSVTETGFTWFRKK